MHCVDAQTKFLELLLWASLISGLEYGLERWNAEWNNSERIIVAADSCN